MFFRSDFLWSVILASVLVLVSASAEFFLPRPEGRETILKQDLAASAGSSRFPHSASDALSPGGGALISRQNIQSAEAYLAAQNTRLPIPFRKPDVPPLILEARSAVAFDIFSSKILYEKNSNEVAPIASLTKLMTAMVAKDVIPADQVLTVSKKAVETQGEAGELWVGEQIAAKKLLAFLLIPSSNDAATALAEHYGADNFIDAMNQKAQSLELRTTKFYNPSGLDTPRTNISTAFELAMLAREFQKDKGLMQITGTREIDLASEDNRFAHHLVNSNALLGNVPGVIGGKTGFTDQAGQTMIVFAEAPDDITKRTSDAVRIVTVVLGSPDRVKESKDLIEWAYRSYEW